MTQTIEQLTARVRELEEETRQLRAIIDEENKDHIEQQAASQAYAEQLREALKRVGCDEACFEASEKPSDWPANVALEALSIPHDTSALDAYVSEKVKEASTQLLEKLEQLTRQRDLAVDALNAWLDIASNCSIESGVCGCGEAMENHSSPMMCGHSPVDMADSVVRSAIQKTDETLALPRDTSALDAYVAYVADKVKEV